MTLYVVDVQDETIIMGDKQPCSNHRPCESPVSLRRIFQIHTITTRDHGNARCQDLGMVLDEIWAWYAIPIYEYKITGSVFVDYITNSSIPVHSGVESRRFVMLKYNLEAVRTCDSMET